MTRLVHRRAASLWEGTSLEAVEWVGVLADGAEARAEDFLQRTERSTRPAVGYEIPVKELRGLRRVTWPTTGRNGASLPLLQPLVVAGEEDVYDRQNSHVMERPLAGVEGDLFV